MTLSGPEKAVLFLLTLDEEVAGPIVRELSDADLRKLRAVASTMHKVPVAALDETCRDFLEKSATSVAMPRGGLRYLRKLSTGAFGEERTKNLFEEGVTSPFARLEMAPADAVAALFADEPPQLLGAILSRLTPPAAAAILAALPEEQRAAAIDHVGKMTEVQASLLEDVANAIARELPDPNASSSVNVDGISRAAEILNATGRELSASLLLTLGDDDPSLADQIRRAMFTFDDLARVDARSMRELVRECPSDRLTLALKGASAALLEAILAGMSSRAAALIRDDLEVLASAKKRDVEAARQEIVTLALRLEEEGRIDLGRGDE